MQHLTAAEQLYPAADAEDDEGAAQNHAASVRMSGGFQTAVLVRVHTACVGSHNDGLHGALSTSLFCKTTELALSACDVPAERRRRVPVGRSGGQQGVVQGGRPCILCKVRGNVDRLLGSQGAASVGL